jgi:hypothetical protein
MIDGHLEPYRPRILRSQFLFLSPGTLLRDFSIAALAKLDEGNSTPIYKVRIGPMCKYEYMHSLVTTSWRQGTIPPESPVWQERMKFRYSWSRLKAKLGVPRYEMGSIARCRMPLALRKGLCCFFPWRAARTSTSSTRFCRQYQLSVSSRVGRGTSDHFRRWG